MYTRFQALTQTAGEALTAFCGTQLTRLAQKAMTGDTALVCERLNGWAMTGTVQVDGIVYNYASRTDAALTGLTVASPNGTLDNVQADHALGAAVADASQSTSGLDLIRRSIFVDTAVGEDLTILGRNLGVPRQPALTGDDHYRAIIRAIAYNPRGTVYGLELALDAMLGAGNYSIVEPFVGKPATVLVNLASDTFLATQAQGNTYVDGRTSVLAQSATEVDLPLKFLAVSELQLQDDRLYVDCRTAKPSAATQARPSGTAQTFTYVGDESQVKLVQLGAGAGASQIQSATGYYTHAANVAPAGTVYAECVFGIPPTTTLSASDARYFAVRVCDGAYTVGFGCVASGTQVGVGLCDATAMGTGALIAGVATTFAKGTVVDVTLEKLGRTTVNLRVNGQLVQTASLTAFPAGTTPTFDFGALGLTAGNGVVRFVGLHTHTPTNYMGTQSYKGASMSGNILTDSQAQHSATISNLPIRVSGGTVKNVAGGLNNGSFVATYQSGTTLTLSAVPHKSGAQVLSGNRLVVSGHANAFSFPDDLGKTVTLSNSQSGNNGTYAIAAVLQNGTGRNYNTFASPITARAHSCLLSNATFTAETGLAWQINPAGIVEGGLSYELSGTGGVAVNGVGVTSLTPPRALPYPQAVYSAQATMEYSAIVVDSELPVVSTLDVGPPATFSIAPAYASDTSNYARAYLTDLVAAGVQLELNYV